MLDSAVPKGRASGSRVQEGSMLGSGVQPKWVLGSGMQWEPDWSPESCSLRGREVLSATCRSPDSFVLREDPVKSPVCYF